MGRAGRVAGRAALLALVLAGAAAWARAGDPPAPAYDPAAFRGGPARAGDLGALKLPGAGARVLWRYDCDQGVGDAVIADGVAYATGDEGTILAVRVDGSGVVWQDDRPGRRFASGPTVAGDWIYVATNRGIAALHRATGATAWEHPIAGGAGESAPLVVGGRIMAAGYDGSIHAVNLDGTLAWTHDLMGDVPPDPPGFDRKRAVIGANAARPKTMAGDGATVFAPIFDQSRLVAVDAATGKRRWSFQARGWIYGEPAVAGGDVFIGSQDGSLYCLDKATGRPRWSHKTGGRIEAGAAVRDGAVYVGSCDGFLSKLDVATGRLLWKFETPPGADGRHFAIYSAPVVDADAACFGSFDGTLYAVDVADGTLRWKLRPVEEAEVTSSPAADGRVVVLGVRHDRDKQAGAHALVGIGTGDPKP